MSGPTAAQTNLTNEETQAYQQAQQMTAEQYGKQSAIYAQLTPQFESILAKGPNQEGFSAGETEDLNAQAVQGTAQNYNQAAKAVGESVAAEGGGTNPLTSGAQTELKEQVADSAAETESSQESQIKQADYQAGAQQYQNAESGLMEIASGEDPLGFENAETGSAGVANNEANAIATEDDSWINSAIGAAGAIGGGWAQGGFKT
jgi:hypothetical protein